MLVLLVLSQLLTVNANADAETIELDQHNTLHIQFKRIAPSQYYFEQDMLRIEVDDSASFLLLPFKQKKMLRAVRYDWKREAGELRLADAAHEAARSGDDAVFKLGLLIEGDPGLSNPFAPAWLKQANAALSTPSDRMIYIVAGAKHPAGESWTSPYNSKVQMTAARHRPLADGWSQASFEFDSPQSVVGLWFMADGDNTDSRFSSRVKNIVLE